MLAGSIQNGSHTCPSGSAKARLYMKPVSMTGRYSRPPCAMFRQVGSAPSRADSLPIAARLQCGPARLAGPVTGYFLISSFTSRAVSSTTSPPAFTSLPIPSIVLQAARSVKARAAMPVKMRFLFMFNSVGCRPLTWTSSPSRASENPFPRPNCRDFGSNPVSSGPDSLLSTGNEKRCHCISRLQL
jgi:hypothetical protein